MRLVAFYLFILAAVLTGSAIKAEETSQIKVSTSSMLNPQAAISFEELSATHEHPLFTPSRKAPVVIPPPPPIAMEPPPAEPPAPPVIALSGVIVDENGPRAMLRTETAGKILPVRLGDDVSGWKVTAIDRQHITLALDERSMSVALFEPKDQTGSVQRHTHTAQEDRVFEVNSAGVLRSHRIHHTH